MVTAMATVRFFLLEVAALLSVMLSYAAVVRSIDVIPAFLQSPEDAIVVGVLILMPSYWYAWPPLLMAMKRDCHEEVNCKGDEGGRQQRGQWDGGKSNEDGIKGGKQSTAMRAMVTRVAAEQRQLGRWQQ